VVTSSGSDTYSTIAAALGSLKGPKHGGANIKVTQMMEDLKVDTIYFPKLYLMSKSSCLVTRARNSFR
jgi:citrate synthase